MSKNIKANDFITENYILKRKAEIPLSIRCISFQMKNLGHQCVLLGHPDEKGKQLLPPYNVVNPLGD